VPTAEPGVVRLGSPAPVSGSGFRRLGRSCYGGAYFRQPKVQNLGVSAALGHENIGWLDVALEAAERLRVAGHFIGQEFQAYKTVQRVS